MVAGSGMPGGRGRVWGPHIDEDICLDLLHNLLPPDERDKILSHLAVCPACERLFQERAAERERLRSQPMLGSAPAAALESTSEAPWASLQRAWAGISRMLPRPRFQLASATVIAAAVVLLIVWLRPASPPLGLQMLPESSIDTRFRGIVPSGSLEDLMSGLAAYASKDFERAAHLLAGTKVRTEYEDLRKIYLASALAWTKEYREALEILEAVEIETLPDGFREETMWTLYVCVAKSGQQARADSLLSVLVHEPGPIGERARRLRDE